MDTIIAKSVGRQIQLIRKNRGLSQADLAQMVDLSSKYLSNVECGDKLPKMATFIDIANALKIDANSLLCGVLNDANLAQSGLCQEVSNKIGQLPVEKQAKVLRILEAIVKEESEEN